jgi:phage major head subunit gpT-like protein
VPVTTDAVLDAFKSASDEQLAAVGLARTSTTTTESTEPTGQRVTESGEPKTSFVAGLMIREKLNEAGLAQMRESITARLPERITESDVDREIAAYKGMIGDFERAGLRPTVTTQVVQESLDKKSKALDNFFAQNWTEGYHSFKQAWADITGYRQIDWSEDISRRIMRESFGAGFDSGVRSTESMDTTTWAQVLGDSITRRMQQAYNNPSLQSWRQIVSSITPVTDFRTQRVGRVGGYGELPTVAEGGPYQPLTSPPDEEATGALAKKGGTEDVTLEMIANDDRRAISKIPDKLGRAAAQTLYRAVWDTFANNATCTFDSTALFHTNHANTDTSAGLAQSTLSTGRRKMIEQAAYGDSTEILTLTPKFLVVPPELEEVAFMLSGSLAVPASNTVGASDQRNIHSGIQPILIPYFTDANDWFLVADPNDVPTLEVGFFNGRQEPELFSQADNNVGSVFNSDVFTWKIRFIFYVMILDYRGVYRGVG